MRKTDISIYNDESTSGSSISVGTAVGGFFAALRKVIVTAFMIFLITAVVIGISIIFYLFSIANEPLNINLNKMKLSLTSFVYVLKEDCDVSDAADTNNYEKYQELYSGENRVWVKYQDIPKHMIDAQVAIEDKRFWEHNGVDWYRTGGAIFSLATGGSQYGGSTITQQLIKNITNDNDVSITRKLREIFRAMKLEDEYTKDDIIEAYLNIVNYGAGCRGVQSAADIYFNKNIADCSIAECAAIAGITQNPVALNPLDYPDNNKTRREYILYEMYDQKMITKQEYDAAMKESENMKFIGYVIEEDDDDDNDWNWYMDRVFRDVVKDLQPELNIGADYAEDMIYNEGLNIYCAMDKKAQEIAEKKIREWKTPKDEKLEVGYEMMDFEGRVLATVGSRFEKDGRLVWDNVTNSVLQPGSTIKPIASYVIALENEQINFSSLVSDRPVSDWGLVDGQVISGPNNWYGSYYGDIPVTRALNISSNGAAVSVVKMVGLEESYKFLTEKLNFQHLDPDHDNENLAGLSIGGFYGGTTVEEMTSSYQIFVNGGYYYQPYTYFMVTDNEGNIIIDNTDIGKPSQVISTETSTIMNRLLHEVVNSGGETMGYRAKIDGWDIIGKTGTTDNSCDNWFIGASPYALAGIWAGHDTSSPIAEDEVSKNHYLWRDIMEEWLKGKAVKNYDLGGDVVQHNYIIDDGGLTDLTIEGKTAVGYYTTDNMPANSTYGQKKTESSKQTSYSNDDNEESSEDDTEYSEDENSDDENNDSEYSDDTGEPEEPATDEPELPSTDDEPYDPDQGAEEPYEPYQGDDGDDGGTDDGGTDDGGTDYGGDEPETGE